MPDATHALPQHRRRAGGRAAFRAGDGERRLRARGFVVLLNALVDVSVSFAAGSVGRRLRGNARLWRRQRRATGAVLVGLGAYAATGR